MAPTRALESKTRTAVLSALEEGIVVIDRAGRLTESNPAASRILGVDLDVGAKSPAWREQIWACRGGRTGTLDVERRVLASGDEARDIEVEIDRHGTEARLSVNYVPFRNEFGAVGGLVLSIRDISGRSFVRRNLLETQERLREAHDVARLASWEWHPDSGDVTVFQPLTGSGMEPGSRVSLDAWLAMIPKQHHKGAQDDFAAFKSGACDETIRRFRSTLATGPVWLEFRSRAVRDVDGRLECVRGTAQDVTEQELARQELASTRDFLQATFDSLPTHVAVLDQGGEIVLTNRAWDNFALDNGGSPDSTGVGSNYLAACDADKADPSAARAATGLRGIIAGNETEFSMENRCQSPEVDRWFQMRATRFEGPGPTRVVVTHENVSERKAEERLVSIDLDKLAWVARIEEALTNDRFVLHAQPILELATGRVTQHELLIRMRHPEGSDKAGLVPPGYFLPVAEEFGLIMAIDRWVIDRAAELAASGLPVELNVSGRSICDPRLVDHIRSAVDRTGAKPEMMVFEITETALVDNDVSARAFVAKLHDLGCKVALDDFGTGYGGFTFLKHLSVDYLKIDVEFVTDLLYNTDSRMVVQAIVNLARGFGLQTVAEGVENAATVDALRDLQVDFVQGYHIGRPAEIAPGDGAWRR